MYKKITDEELLEYIINRNELAFEEVVDRYAKSLYFLAYRFLYSKELSEDIVQECFIKIWQNPEKFNVTKASAKTYFYKITINLCIDYKRKNKNCVVFLNDGADNEIVGTDKNAEEHLLKTEAEKNLFKAMQKLPKKQEVALSLYYFKELKQKEVAEIMSVSVKNVEILIFRAKKNLQKELEGYDEL